MHCEFLCCCTVCSHFTENKKIFSNCFVAAIGDAVWKRKLNSRFVHQWWWLPVPRWRPMNNVSAIIARLRLGMPRLLLYTASLVTMVTRVSSSSNISNKYRTTTAGDSTGQWSQEDASTSSYPLLRTWLRKATPITRVWWERALRTPQHSIIANPIMHPAPTTRTWLPASPQLPGFTTHSSLSLY